MDSQMVAAEADPPRGAATDAARRGLVIAVLGPDGAGKSTVLAALADRLGDRGTGCQSFHWRVTWRAPGGHAPPVVDPHGRPPKNMVASIAQLGYHVALSWPAWWRRVRPALGRGQWVLLDRGYSDLLCDPVRYRYGGPIGLAKVWLRCLPRPDLTVVLVAPPTVIRERKQEVSQQELARQLEAYRSLAGRPRHLLIESTDPPAVIADRILAHVGSIT